nr:MAG: hypothetical protein [Bacteriophage sp.]
MKNFPDDMFVPAEDEILSEKNNIINLLN